ncbi:MAG: beta-N-acetylglucosaminidase [Dehalobacter sp. 4CP]|uniref:protein O-GlcNAcase n=1 Tax=Dehalobacter sp. CP TaxID=2594474 RepID=UPI0013C6D8A8|nr:protein O-GlcNAcase [Dehalobacter sp.]NBJ15942.1 beta-N-acetylglucosaminidase [Dehalobacter sp. 4CP]
MKKKIVLLSLTVLLFGLGITAIAYHNTPIKDYLFGWTTRSQTQTNGQDQTQNHRNDTTAPYQQPGADNEQTPPTDSFAIRGVIEGFYGTPWTMAQRINMLTFIGQHHFNTYVYAPKDDPYQRTNWVDLYPIGQLQQMKSLVQSAKANGVNFVYSISPGIPSPLPGETLTSAKVANSITFTSKADVQLLESKIDQLRSIGVHTFMLSFDDVQHYLKSSDQQVYGSDYPKAHIDLANKLLKDETVKDSSFRLWLAPTDYYGLKDSAYWATIRSHLDPSIQVIWTGSWVLNKSITSSEADQVRRLLGRKPLIWDNYPVNDYTYVVKKAPQLFMGPLINRSEDLSAYTSGMLANPMLQPEASKIALYTVSQYLYNPSAYQPLQAWDEALQSMSGIGDALAFRKFCQYSSQSTLDTSDNTGFSKLAGAFWQEYQSGQHGPSESELRKELQLLSALPDNLKKTITNQQLLAEISPWAVKLGEEGQAGLQALVYLDLSSNDPQKLTAKQQLQTSLQQLRNNNLQIGSEVLSFINKAGSN